MKMKEIMKFIYYNKYIYLMDKLEYAYNNNYVVYIKILTGSCKHRAAEIARRRRGIFTLLVY